MNDFSFMQAYSDVNGPMRTGQGLISSDPDMAAASFRKALEAVAERFVIMYGISVLPSDPGRPPTLNDTITALAAVAPQQMIDDMRKVQSIGNKGVHSGEKGHVFMTEAERAEDAMYRVCAFYVNANAQVGTPLPPLGDQPLAPPTGQPLPPQNLGWRQGGPVVPSAGAGYQPPPGPPYTPRPGVGLSSGMKAGCVLLGLFLGLIGLLVVYLINKDSPNMSEAIKLFLIGFIASVALNACCIAMTWNYLPTLP